MKKETGEGTVVKLSQLTTVVSKRHKHIQCDDTEVYMSCMLTLSKSPMMADAEAVQDWCPVTIEAGSQARSTLSFASANIFLVNV